MLHINSVTILVRKKLKPEYRVWSKIRFKHGLKDITFRTEHKLLFKLNLLHLKSSEHALKYLKWGHTCCDLTVYTQRVFMLLLNLIYKYTYVILVRFIIFLQWITFLIFVTKVIPILNYFLSLLALKLFIWSLNWKHVA